MPAVVSPAFPADTDDTGEAPRLAADLGHALDALHQRTGSGVVAVMDRHELTPAEAGVLIALDRAPVAPTPDEETDAALDREVAGRALARLAERALVAAGARGPRLTSAGREVVREMEQARRSDLRAFVATLDRAGRRRIEAAIDLLLGAPAHTPAGAR